MVGPKWYDWIIRPRASWYRQELVSSRRAFYKELYEKIADAKRSRIVASSTRPGKADITAPIDARTAPLE